MLIDSHCHLNMDYFKTDYKEVAKRALEKELEAIILIGTNYSDSKRGIEIANEIEGVYSSIGWHPHDTKEIKDLNNLLKIMELAKDKKVVAYGEIGLDYFKKYSPVDVQKRFFRYQINIAKELKLPIIIHDRDAHDDIIKILTEENGGMNSGVIHCFSGDYDYAKKVLDLNFYISFPGTITFKKNQQFVKELIKKIPLDRILIETDAPFLTPEPYRGKRNEPLYVKYVAMKIAEFLNIDYEKIVEITTMNTKKLFGLR